MTRRSKGSIHLFQAFGIDVFLHWSWFIIAVVEYQYASQNSYFQNPVWHIAVYLTLFAIVTIHEFGHALACRSVGGYAERIVLWPLGGIAFVRPPQRPGAELWSIAAGPLVNVALVPITLGLLVLFHVPIDFPAAPATVAATWTDPQRFVIAITVVNAVLLCFNLLPIYPLDGGQILQAILWFIIGRAKSLSITAFVGILGAIAGGVYALYQHDLILLAIAAFVGYQAYNGFRAASEIAAAENAAEQRARTIAGIDQ